MTVDAVVQDGRIKSLTYSGFGQPAQVAVAVDGRAQVPAAFGLAAVGAVLFGVLLVASTGATRAGGAGSRLHGRLMRDLRGWSAARQ